jgi:hypothetical protein
LSTEKELNVKDFLCSHLSSLITIQGNNKDSIALVSVFHKWIETAEFSPGVNLIIIDQTKENVKISFTK